MWPFSGNHFVEQNAESVDVALLVDYAMDLFLLRGHVVDGADGRATHGECGHRIFEIELGESKVCDTYIAFFIEQNVGRFEVAVDNALLMGVAQSFDYLTKNM